MQKTKMTIAYDKHYQTKNLFGEPFSELVAFFTEYSKKEKVLDLGCGQGRDSIPLARLGYDVTGIDNSKVGIEQMSQVARTENLKLVGLVADIYQFEDFGKFDIILINSMFHFGKKEEAKEASLIKKIISRIKIGCLIVVCIQDTGNKVQILNQAIDYNGKLDRVADRKFKYIFEDKTLRHKSESDYRMIIVKKSKNTMPKYILKQ